jgi:hypothetical protein
VTRIKVDYRHDGVMRTDVVKTRGWYSVSRKHGYVKVNGETRLYRRIERVVIIHKKASPSALA